MQLPAQQPKPLLQASPRYPQHESPSQLPLQQSSAVLHVQYEPAARQELDVPPLVDAPPAPEPPRPLAPLVAPAPLAPPSPAERRPPVPLDPSPAPPDSPASLAPASGDDASVPASAPD